MDPVAGRFPSTASNESGESGIRSNQDHNRDLISVLIFRLGQEWLAFRTPTVAEVTLPSSRAPDPSSLQRDPHRPGQPSRTASAFCVTSRLAGRGRPRSVRCLIPPCPISPSRQRPMSRRWRTAGLSVPHGSRLVVLRDRERSETWLFAAEEVLGVHRLSRAQLRSVSSSLANPEVSFSQAILSWEGRSIGFLDEQRVFAALRSIGQ